MIVSISMIDANVQICSLVSMVSEDWKQLQTVGCDVFRRRSRNMPAKLTLRSRRFEWMSVVGDGLLAERLLVGEPGIEWEVEVGMLSCPLGEV